MISRISKYPVESELGRGGMGRVYRAWDPDVNRPVAIKVLEAESDPELLRRFRAEIDTTGNLQHKNIVTLYECGEDAGVPYLVMELLPGQTLESVIKNHVPLTLLDKVRIMTQVAQGLSYAHSRKVIHRDVKPGNIMLLPDSSVKIMDFGIARVITRKTVMTQEGLIFGTIPYMAPEQFEPGGKADEQTDIFSYAGVYYELLTGKQPFSVSDFYATIRRIKTFEPESVGQLVPGCPEALELLVHRAMAKDREVRYESFAELLLDSESILVDLEHELAAAILAEVDPLIKAGDLEAAELKLAQAVELEPGNRGARELRRTVRKKIDEDKIAKRVASLFTESDAHIENRQFAEAVQTLETALRLNKSDPEVQRRLFDANARLNAHLRANKLVAEARRDQQKGQLPEALRRLREALEYDPRHTDARLLLPRAEAELGRRSQEERIQRAIAVASERRSQQKYDEALAALSELGSDEEGRVAELRAGIQRDKAEAERRNRAERFNIGASKVREALKASDLSRAGQQLDFLAAQFSDVPRAAEVLPQLRSELDAQLRALAISGYTKRARDLLGTDSAKEALDVLNEALNQFPYEADLLRLRQESEAKYAEQRRAEAVAEVLKKAQALRRSGQLIDALNALAEGRQRTGDDAAIGSFTREIQAELEQQRYAAGLRELTERLRELTREQRFEDAILAIEAAPEYRVEPEIAGQLAAARSAAAALREQREVKAALESAASAERDEGLERALGVIEGSLRSYPRNSNLEQAAQGLRDRIAQDRRRAQVADHHARIERAIQAGNWKDAEAAVEKAKTEFRGEGQFDELSERVRRGLFDVGVRQAADQMREMLAANRLKDVAEKLNQTRTMYSGDPLWMSLEQDVARRQGYEAGLNDAEKFYKRGELEKAEARLAALIEQGAWDERAARMLEQVRYGLGLREAENLRKSGELKRAEQRLADLVKDKAADDRAARLLGEVRYESGLAEAEALRERGELGKAEQQLTQLVKDKAADDRAARMLGEVRYESGLAESEALRKRGEWGKAEQRLAELVKDKAGDDRAARILGEVRYESGLADAEALRKRAEWKKAEQRLADLVANRAPDDRAARMLGEVRYETGLAEAEALRKSGELEKAQARLTGLIGSANDDRAARLLADVRYDLRLTEAQKSVKLGNLENAQAILSALIRGGAAPDDRAARTLGEVEHSIGLRDAQSLRSRGELAKAEERLLQLARGGDTNDRVTRLLEEIRSDRLAEAQRAVERGDFDAGLRLMDALRMSAPPEWAARLNVAREEALNKKRAGEVTRVAGAVRERLKRDEIGQAQAELAAAQARAPGEHTWTALQLEIDERKKLLDRTKEPVGPMLGELQVAQSVPSNAAVALEPEPKPVAGPWSTNRWLALAGTLALTTAAGIYWFETRPGPKVEKPPTEQLARVRLSSIPNGATVKLNGQTCTTPCELQVQPGSYAVIARLDGYEPSNKELVVGSREVQRGGDIKISLRAVPPPPSLPSTVSPGTVEIRTNQDDATVLLNGARYGLASLNKPVVASVQPGDYRIRVEKPNYAPAEQKLHIEAGQNKRLTLALNPLPGRVTLSGALPGTVLGIDGVVKATVPGSGTLTTDVAAGQHRIRLSHDDYSPRDETIQVDPNQTLTLDRGRVQLTKVAAPPPDPAEVARQELGRVENDPDRLEEFASKYRGTPAAAEAMQRVAQLRAARRDQIAREQAAKEQAARDQISSDQAARQKSLQDPLPREPADRVRPDPQAADRKGIADALARYQGAYANKDLNALRAVWPNVPGPTLDSLKKGFKVYKSVRMDLRPIGTPLIQGNSATLSCERAITAVGGPRYQPDSINIRFQKNGGGWQIVAIE